jgi:hypothetical protein
MPHFFRRLEQMRRSGVLSPPSWPADVPPLPPVTVQLEDLRNPDIQGYNNPPASLGMTGLGTGLTNAPQPPRLPPGLRGPLGAPRYAPPSAPLEAPVPPAEMPLLGPGAGLSIRVIPALGITLCAQLAAGLFAFFWTPGGTNYQWMTEINPISREPFGSLTEYAWVGQLTRVQKATLTRLFQEARDSSAGVEAQPATRRRRRRREACSDDEQRAIAAALGNEQLEFYFVESRQLLLQIRQVSVRQLSPDDPARALDPHVRLTPSQTARVEELRRRLRDRIRNIWSTLVCCVLIVVDDDCVPKFMALGRHPSLDEADAGVTLGGGRRGRPASVSASAAPHAEEMAMERLRGQLTVAFPSRGSTPGWGRLLVFVSQVPCDGTSHNCWGQLQSFANAFGLAFTPSQDVNVIPRQLIDAPHGRP